MASVWNVIHCDQITYGLDSLGGPQGGNDANKQRRPSQNISKMLNDTKVLEKDLDIPCGVFSSGQENAPVTSSREWSQGGCHLAQWLATTLVFTGIERRDWVSTVLRTLACFRINVRLQSPESSQMVFNNVFGQVFFFFLFSVGVNRCIKSNRISGNFHAF